MLHDERLFAMIERPTLFVHEKMPLLLILKKAMDTARSHGIDPVPMIQDIQSYATNEEKLHRLNYYFEVSC